MPAKKAKDEINLLPQKGFEATTTGRVLAWILSTFRIIVIVTEIIVMIAFLSRFWFDAQNSDLNEKIQQKQAVLIASRNFETEFKDTQKRLNILSELLSERHNESSVLTDITNSLTSDMLLTQIKITSNKLEISGITSNEKSIQQFIANANSKNSLKSFTILEIKNDLLNTTNLNFTISGEVKKT